MNKEKLVSTIDWVENIWLPENEIDSLVPNIRSEVDKLVNLVLVDGLSLLKLEQVLRENYGEWVLKYINDVRFANCFAWKNTQLHRDAKTIIIPKWSVKRISEANMWNSVIDPIWFSSKVPAPTEWYGLLWKIPEFRPMDNKFNMRLFNELMSTWVELKFKWVAYEVWVNDAAIMPTFEINGWEDIISTFSEWIRDSDIPTAKYYWINI